MSSKNAPSVAVAKGEAGVANDAILAVPTLGTAQMTKSSLTTTKCWLATTTTICFRSSWCTIVVVPSCRSIGLHARPCLHSMLVQESASWTSEGAFCYLCHYMLTLLWVMIHIGLEIIYILSVVTVILLLFIHIVCNMCKMSQCTLRTYIFVCSNPINIFNFCIVTQNIFGIAKQ